MKNLIHWKENKNFNSDFAFILTLKFELWREYWSKEPVKWFDLVKVWVIDGSSYRVILTREY